MVCLLPYTLPLVYILIASVPAEKSKNDILERCCHGFRETRKGDLFFPFFQGQKGV